MTDERYNGWTNYETWAVGMFLDGNYTGEGTYREVLALAQDVVDEIDTPTSYSTVADLRIYELADRLKDLVDLDCEQAAGASLAQDLIRAALDDVDWRELADHKLAEIAENES